MQRPDADRPDLPSMLEKAGFSFAGLHKITFGPGVVGKITTGYIAVATLCALGMMAGVYLREETMVYISLSLAFAGFLFTAAASMIFAARNPAAALLEGAALVNYHQVEAGMRGLPSPPAQPNVEPPHLENRGSHELPLQSQHKVGEDRLRPEPD